MTTIAYPLNWVSPEFAKCARNRCFRGKDVRGRKTFCEGGFKSLANITPAVAAEYVHLVAFKSEASRVMQWPSVGFLPRRRHHLEGDRCVAGKFCLNADRVYRRGCGLPRDMSKGLNFGSFQTVQLGLKDPPLPGGGGLTQNSALSSQLCATSH